MNRNRCSIRLKGYDYSQAGVYFVTICTHNHRGKKSFAPYLFGEIIDGEMVLNDVGRLVAKCWRDIPAHFPHVELDEFIVMPNHVHGILSIVETVGAKNLSSVRAKNLSPLLSQQRPGTSKTIGSIIRGFKIGVTKWMRKYTPIHEVWQRNYYDHIIRNEDELNAIREYIINNPLKWEFDRENPNIIVGARQAVPLPPGPDWEAGT